MDRYIRKVPFSEEMADAAPFSPKRPILSERKELFKRGERNKYIKSAEGTEGFRKWER